MNVNEINEIEKLVKRSNYPLSAQTLSVQLKQTTGLEVKPLDIENYLLKVNNNKIRTISDKNLYLFLFEGEDSDYTDADIQKKLDEENLLEKEAYPIVKKFLREVHSVESNYDLFAQEKTKKFKDNKRIKKGYNRHRYPDLVGIYKPFDKIENIPKYIIKDIIYPIFTYEVKTNLLMHNVRSTFFECLSNSIFANKRYVVIAKEGDKAIDPEALKEFRKLSSRYDVGLIEIRILDKNNKTYDEINSQMLLDCKSQAFDYELFYDYINNFANLKEIHNFFNESLKI